MESDVSETPYRAPRPADELLGEMEKGGGDLMEIVREIVLNTGVSPNGGPALAWAAAGDREGAIRNVRKHLDYVRSRMS